MTDTIKTKWLGRIPFERGLQIQEETRAAVEAGEHGDTAFFLEHEPVYTTGRTRDRSSLGAPASLPHPVIETNRGGKATYHGPGQLVGYLIIDLRRRGRDLHAHLRSVEDVLIKYLESVSIPAGRADGLTGVWVSGRKIASIGVGVRRWVTMHGFALNVTRESLTPFGAITPCGIEGVKMTCIEHESGREADVRSTAEAIGDTL